MAIPQWTSRTTRRGRLLQDTRLSYGKLECQQCWQGRQPYGKSILRLDVRRETRERILDGAGLGAGVSTYCAVPKSSPPQPSQPSYRRTEVQRPAVPAPAPSTAPRTNCPGNVAADENCRPLRAIQKALERLASSSPTACGQGCGCRPRPTKNKPRPFWGRPGLRVIGSRWHLYC